MDHASKRSRITIVSPCFDEHDVIGAFVDEVGRIMASIPDIEWRLLLVDDGSRDGTGAVIDGLRAGRPWLEHLAFTRNFGHQTALSAGLEHAGGDATIIMDSDLQHPPDLLPEMIALWRSGHDVVAAVRRHTDGVGPFKRWSSDLFYRVFNRMSDVRLTPGTADFCLISRRVRRSLTRMPERHRFLRGMIAWLGHPRHELAYVARARAAGVSKYPLRRMIALAMDAVLAFSVRPLRIAKHVGLMSMLAGFAYLVVIVVCHMRGETVSGWTSIMAGILGMGGIQLMVLGIMSEYMARQTELLRGRPLYVVHRRTRGTWTASAVSDPAVVPPDRDPA